VQSCESYISLQESGWSIEPLTVPDCPICPDFWRIQLQQEGRALNECQMSAADAARDLQGAACTGMKSALTLACSPTQISAIMGSAFAMPMASTPSSPEAQEMCLISHDILPLKCCDVYELNGVLLDQNMQLTAPSQTCTLECYAYI